MSQKIDREYILLGLKIAGDFGVSIAVPVALFVFIGRRVDTAYGMWPTVTIVGFVLAAVVTGYIIKKKAVSYGQVYQNLIDKENKEKNKQPPTDPV